MAAVPSAAPTLDHEALSSFPKGEAVILKARIRSPIGKKIFAPTAFIRVAGIEGFARVALEPVAGVPDMFTALLPAGLAQGDFEYYLEAFDEEGNGPTRVGAPKAPLRVKAIASMATVPPPPPPVVEGVSATPAGEATKTAAGRPWQRPVGIGLAVGGAAIVVGALVAGGVALERKSRMQSASSNADHQDAKEQAESAARVFDVAGPIGLVAAGVGAGLLVFGPKQSVGVSIAAGRDGAGLVMSGRF